MKKIIPILMVILYTSTQAQMPGKRPTEYGFDIDYKPPIYYDLYLSFGDTIGEPELVFSLNVQNDLLQFTKVADTYKAVYHIGLTIKKSSSESAVFSRVWKQTVQERDFERTNSRSIYQGHQKIFDLDLEPGEYLMFVEVTDDGTKKAYRNSRQLTIPVDKPGDLIHTPIRLLDPEYDQSGEVIAEPRDPMIEFNHDIVASFELQTDTPDSLIITSKLLQFREESGSIIRQKIFRLLPTGPLMKFRERIQKNDLDEGIYSLRYRIRYGERILEIEKKFEVVWFDKPVYLYRYDLAIRPMRYILSESEWNIADELSYNDLETWFKSYWQKKDPSPETPFNEIMYTFFQRVDQTNRLYAQRFKEGWETDRGKSYLLYGKPDRQDVNRTSVSAKPYEVWYYESLNQKLTFIDEYNDEDYKLVLIEEIKESEDE